ncbi:MAG: hypothetical protein A2571_03515 [Candidatus Vogelbacteria bacterium RIFOXYD1_FULL_44_32]|uniref:Bifunctional protein FolD n=1 Tax=Candidatus Vogelbacteria bacterium RIFOXYD1_FULL_44_32 TaxID=1802438 RepID=A0A1G2QES5_9BACT|nr:MAG: hypothetical protein A2571_03515 [Candidatus Vogelbacteria bacterium RIFOXYD1_FULL_44_32]
MIVKGQVLAENLLAEIKLKAEKISGLTLVVIAVGTNPLSERYIKIKTALAQKIGIEIKFFEFEESITESELINEIIKLNDDKSVTGIVVQLPLPGQLNTAQVLATIDPNKDPDALSSAPVVVAPVALAVAEIFRAHNINVSGKNAVVVGRGRLVGQPVALYLVSVGAEVKQFDLANKNDLAVALAQADIVVSGAGVPGLIKPQMLKVGVVLIDAATSESNGKLAGDADPECADRCSLFTPVPGGVGPLTVICLFKNVIALGSKQRV